MVVILVAWVLEKKAGDDAPEDIFCSPGIGLFKEVEAEFVGSFYTERRGEARCFVDAFVDGFSFFVMGRVFCTLGEEAICSCEFSEVIFFMIGVLVDEIFVDELGGAEVIYFSKDVCLFDSCVIGEGVL